MDLHTAFERALPTRDWPQAARTGVLVGLVETRDWQPWLADAHALIDARERARAQRQRRAQDREILVLAYAMHRLLLGRALEVTPAEVPLQRDDLGCPRLADGAAHTSLSHAQGWVGVAIAVSGPVGIDLEPATRASELPEIAARICHHTETGALAGLREDARAAALLALWVRKEAFLKAEGIGLAREMADFPLADGDLLPLASVAGGKVRVGMIEAGAQCVVAVAGPPGAAIHHTWLRPQMD